MVPWAAATIPSLWRRIGRLNVAVVALLHPRSVAPFHLFRYSDEPAYHLNDHKLIDAMRFLLGKGYPHCPGRQGSARNVTALSWPHDYQVVNIGKLPATDVRTGCPTPTLLWKGEDIFGMPAPHPPYNVPS